VRRLLSPLARTGVWLALEAVVLGYVLVVEARPEAGSLFTMPGFVLEFVGFVAAAAALAMLAFRSGVPGAPRGGVVRVFALVAFLVAVLHVVSLPFRTDGSLGDFLAGRVCAAHMAALAVVPWLAMLIALRRAAPFRGAMAGALAAGAASLMAFAFMRITCPSEEMIHVVTWHGLPVLAALVVSAVVGALWLPGWRR